jgi:hypothetical protein
MKEPTKESAERIRKYVQKYWEKTGTNPHPDPDVTEGHWWAGHQPG